jgi:cell division protein FtsI/penicillin-binding protein 2
VLQARLAGPSSSFPVVTEATLSGVKLENANRESCGGTLAQSFAKSCNSVFAPLGARLGARRLVAMARRFGFGEAPAIPGAATPSLPAAGEIGDDLAVGSTAIGQGRVAATALQMALVAATIADGGRRPRPTLQLGARLPPARAVSPRVARTVARLMRGVVRFGTGTSAALPGVAVAGKTGTAELESTVKAAGDQAPEAGATPPAKTTDTDAWFAAFAPSGAHRVPRAAVGVLLVRAGAGGDTAAPAARGILLAALR